MSAEIHNNMHTDKCMAECFDWKGSSLAFTSDELQVHNACTAAATCHSFQTVPTKTHNTRQVNHEIDGKWTTIQWTEYISQIILHAPFVSFLFYQMCIEASLLSPLSPPESMLMRLCFGICEINSAKSSISSQSSATPIQHWFWGDEGGICSIRHHTHWNICEINSVNSTVSASTLNDGEGVGMWGHYEFSFLLR